MERGEIIEEPGLRNKTSVFEDRYHAGNLLAEKIKDGKEVLLPDEDSPEINEGHYSELLDRTWVAIDYIYQFLGCHPLLKKENRLHGIYLKAEEALSDLYQEVGKLEIK